MEQGHQAQHHQSPDTMRRHYVMLALNLLASFIIMYLAMFTMIWRVADFHNNLNMVYMALIMLAPMAILMLAMMSSMFMNAKLNAMLYAAFALVFALAFWATRGQAAVDDRQFVRAMIPHHSGAILMCNRASLHDAEVRDLCFKPNGIVDSQSREIREMNAMLKRL